VLLFFSQDIFLSFYLSLFQRSCCYLYMLNKDEYYEYKHEAFKYRQLVFLFHATNSNKLRHHSS